MYCIRISSLVPTCLLSVAALEGIAFIVETACWADGVKRILKWHVGQGIGDRNIFRVARFPRSFLSMSFMILFD